MSNCPLGLTGKTEFANHEECDVVIDVDFSLRATVIAVALLVLTVECIIWIKRYNTLWEKTSVPKTLLILTTLQNIFMSLRPFLGIILFPSTSYDNVGIAVATHLSCILAASIAILFVYLEARLIRKAARGLKIGNTAVFKFFGENTLRIFISFEILQATMFTLGIPLGYYGVVSKRVAFWVPVVIVDLTVIPFFLILGIDIYLQAKNAIKKRHHRLANKILLTAGACFILGMFTGTIGIVSSLGIFSYTDWVLVELCWLSDIGFNAFIFSLLSRNIKTKSVVVSTGSSEKNTDPVTTASGKHNSSTESNDTKS